MGSGLVPDGGKVVLDLQELSEIVHKLHWFCIVHDFKLFVLFFHRRAEVFVLF